jgi:preprotein translocase subunit YajC
MLKGRRVCGPGGVQARPKKEAARAVRSPSGKRFSSQPWAFPRNFLDARGAEPDFSSSPPKKDCVLTTLLLATPALSPTGSGLVSFLPFLLIIIVFYLLLIRPNQRKQHQWQQMLSNLKTGDKITTSGGIRGTILSIKDDAIQLRIPPDNLRIEVVKSAIASVTTPDEAAKQH